MDTAGEVLLRQRKKKGYFAGFFYNCHLPHYSLSFSPAPLPYYLLILLLQAPLEYIASCPPSSQRFCGSPLAHHINAITFYVSICIGVLTIPPAVRSLGGEKDVFWREAGSQVNRLAYFMGKVRRGSGNAR